MVLQIDFLNKSIFSLGVFSLLLGFGQIGWLKLFPNHLFPSLPEDIFLFNWSSSPNTPITLNLTLPYPSNLISPLPSTTVLHLSMDGLLLCVFAHCCLVAHPISRLWWEGSLMVTPFICFLRWFVLNKSSVLLCVFPPYSCFFATRGFPWFGSAT